MDQLLEIAVIVVPIIVGVFGVAYGVVQKQAAKPAVDGWDKAKEWMDKAKPLLSKVEDWADPGSTAVPPTPRNPKGTKA